MSSSAGTPGGGSGFTGQSSAEEGAGRERFQAGVEEFHWPPTGPLTEQMAEDWFSEFERTHGVSVSGPNRWTFTGALQQGDWHDVVHLLQENPYARALVPAVASSHPAASH